MRDSVVDAARSRLRAWALFANGHGMAKIFALIALILLSGFTGGTDVFATTHATRMTLQFALVPEAESDAGAGHENGTSFARGASEAMDVPESECCTDSTCANVSHCHHGGLSAMMAAHMGGIGSALSRGYGVPRHDIPTQNVSESISKPPRA